MSLIDKILKAKERLKNVEVTVTLEDGTEVYERKGTDGKFEQVTTNSNEIAILEDFNSNQPRISKRRMKKVERARRYGFVVDDKPDLQIANVAKGVYLGSQDVAADFQILKNEGITHIVNCATGVKEFYPKNFKYLKLEILDLPETRLSDYFPITHEFIGDCVQNGGKVFVHCNAGISRSSTLVISYIMKNEGITFEQALKKVKDVRPATLPNDGFMAQLKEYDRLITK